MSVFTFVPLAHYIRESAHPPLTLSFLCRLGDSTTAQMFAALIHEFQREKQRQDIGHILPFTPDETWKFEHFYEYYDYRWVNDVYVWHPPYPHNVTNERQVRQDNMSSPFLKYFL